MNLNNTAPIGSCPAAQTSPAPTENPLVQNARDSRQHRATAQATAMSALPGLTWFLCLLVCTLSAALAFVYLDVPTARYFNGFLGATESLGKGLASAVLLGIEAAVALTLIIIRIVRGRLSRFEEATALACLTSICAYAINDATLKHIFGVPNPQGVLAGARHTFNLMAGSASSSFPSGHMMLAGSFAGVFMRLYRSTVVPLAVLLLIAAALLIVGDWHFVSDVIVGTFLGISAGLLAGEVWLAHSK